MSVRSSPLAQDSRGHSCAVRALRSTQRGAPYSVLNTFWEKLTSAWETIFQGIEDKFHLNLTSGLFFLTWGNKNNITESLNMEPIQKIHRKTLFKLKKIRIQEKVTTNSHQLKTSFEFNNTFFFVFNYRWNMILY